MRKDCKSTWSSSGMVPPTGRITEKQTPLTGAIPLHDKEEPQGTQDAVVFAESPYKRRCMDNQSKLLLFHQTAGWIGRCKREQSEKQERQHTIRVASKGSPHFQLKIS